MANWLKKMAGALVGSEVEDDEYDYYPEYEEEREYQPQQQTQSRDRASNREYRNREQQNNQSNNTYNNLRDVSRDRTMVDRPVREVHVNNQRSQDDNHNGKVVRINSAPPMEIFVAKPETIDDALDICRGLKENKTCLINLEQVQDIHAQRIVDFLSGSAYALNGAVQKVSGDIFLVCPMNVSISGKLKEEIKQGNFSFPKVNYK